MSSGLYLRFEILRTVRNRGFLLFTLGFPAILYIWIAGQNRHDHDLVGTGISAPLYFMVSLAAFGTMTAMLSTGARISSERTIGWTRQLRVSPLSPVPYFRTKLMTSYLMALLTIAVLYACGALEGVSLPTATWIEMTCLMLVALIPLAALGILVGHLLNGDATRPLIGGGTALLAFLSGTWFPIANHGMIHDVAIALPSYWLVQASRVSIGDAAWGVTGWAVVLGWTVVLSLAAVWAYRRDDGRA